MVTLFTCPHAHTQVHTNKHVHTDTTGKLKLKPFWCGIILKLNTTNQLIFQKFREQLENEEKLY